MPETSLVFGRQDRAVSASITRSLRALLACFGSRCAIQFLGCLTDLLSFFFKQQDAAGIATALQNSSVNGADFLAFASWEELVDELSVVKFMAKKALRLRTGFLDGSISLF